MQPWDIYNNKTDYEYMSPVNITKTVVTFDLTSKNTNLNAVTIDSITGKAIADGKQVPIVIHIIYDRKTHTISGNGLEYCLGTQLPGVSMKSALSAGLQLHRVEFRRLIKYR